MLHFAIITFRFQEIVNKFENSLQLPEDLDRTKGTVSVIKNGLWCLKNLCAKCWNILKDYCRQEIKLSLVH